MKSQKLSIYLIKDDITDHIDIVKDINTKKEFNGGILYYKKSHANPPSWANNFFNKNIEELNNSSASGLYITKINYKNKDIYFGVSFGHGWQMFKDGAIVEQFGIKTALSIIKDEIKKIEKKNFKNGLKDVSEQLGKTGSVTDFGFDVEQDIMRAIVGEPENKELYGEIVTGKDAISLSTKKDVDEVKDLLAGLYKAYISNKYKKKFDWFDNFSSVSDKKLISELDNEIVEKIKNDSLASVIYWLSIPEVIEWENTKCFKYDIRLKGQEYQDITLEDFKNSLNDNKKERIDLGLLKKEKAHQIDINDQVIREWSVYKCLYAEIDFENEKYLLVSSKYYKVDKDYKTKIENECSIDTSFALPDWDKRDYENIYNSKIESNDSTYQCLDGGVSKGNLIGKGQIEFADLVRSDNYLIHVKKYGGSSVLSHLFSQGFVSADLLLTDESFREEVNKKLKDSHKNVIIKSEPNPQKYTIVYAIGTDKSNFKLPFFSLINYRNIKKQLKLYQYNVLLVKIKQI